MSRLDPSVRNLGRVHAGSAFTDSGKSPSCERPTRASSRPSAQTISVLDAISETTRMPRVPARSGRSPGAGRSAGGSIEFRGARLAGVVDVDGLPLGIEVDRGAAHLALADAGRLHPAERQVRLAPH